MPGRPVKRSADWFPHEAHASDRSKTLTVMENHFGAEGYMAWFKLLERLTAANNHTIACYSTEESEFLAAKLKLAPERFEVIMAKVADLNGIDRDLWKDHRLIWCQNLVDNLLPVYEKRKQEPPHKPAISGTETPISGTETPIYSPEMQQRDIVEVSSKERGSSNVRPKSKETRKRDVEVVTNLSHAPACELVGPSLAVFQVIEENLRLSAADTVEAQNACLRYRPEWIRGAVKEACDHNKLTWKYTVAILRRWESEGKR